MAEIGATPKKKRKQGIPKRMPMEREERLDYHIRSNKELIKEVKAIEEEEFDIKDEEDVERVIRQMDRRDKCLEAGFNLEYKIRMHVIFDDLAEEENVPLDEVIGIAPNPIFFYEMDLEPLNKMITDFVNKPGGFLADYLIPERDDIQKMLNNIRDNGDCPLYDIFVPTEKTEALDDYISNILSVIKERIRQNRMVNWADTFQEIYNVPNDVLELNPVMPLTLAQTLKQLKEEGTIIKEEDPHGEEIDDNSDSQSETESEVSTQENVQPSESQDQNMQKNADDDANEIIELDSDAETSESEDGDDIFAMEDEMEKQAHLNGTADENRGEKPLNVQKGNHAEIVEEAKKDLTNVETDEKIHEVVEESMEGVVSQESIVSGQSATTPPITQMDTTPTPQPKEQHNDDDSIICIDD